MLETSYTDAEKLANDIVQTLVNNGFDESGKAMNLGAGPSAVKIGSSTIKLSESAGGSITINEDGLDWKMLDPEIKNLIHGVATASGERPQMETGNNNPGKDEEIYLERGGGTEIVKKGDSYSIGDRVKVRSYNKSTLVGVDSPHMEADSAKGMPDVKCLMWVKPTGPEDKWMAHLNGGGGEISFKQDGGVLHIDYIHVPDVPDWTDGFAVLMDIAINVANHMGYRLVSGMLPHSSILSQELLEYGIAEEDISTESEGLYFETDAF